MVSVNLCIKHTKTFIGSIKYQFGGADLEGRPKRMGHVGWGVDEKGTSYFLFVRVPEKKKTFRFYKLNLVGGRVWELCDGSKDFEEIVDIISQEFEVSKKRANMDVAKYLEKLQVLQLLQF